MRITHLFSLRALWRVFLGSFLLALPWVMLEIFPRVILADVLILIAGLLFLLQGLLQQRIPKPTPETMGYGIGIGFWIMAVLFVGLDVPHIGVYGFEAIALIYLAILSGFLAYVLPRLEDVNWAWEQMYFGLVLCLLFGLIGLFMGIQGRWSPLFYNNARKLTATFNYPNQLAGFLVLFIPGLWEAWVQAATRKERWRYGLVFLLLLIELLATGSRTGTVVAIFGIMLSCGWTLVQRPLRALLTGGLLLGTTLWIAALLMPSIPVVRRAYQGVTVAMTGSISDSFRHQNWRLAVYLFTQHPIQGYGIANIAVDFGYEIHNTFLAVPAEMGLSGTLVIGAIFGYTLYLGWKNVYLTRHMSKAGRLARGLFFGLLSELLFATQHFMLRSRHLWAWMALIVALYSALHRGKNSNVWHLGLLDTE